MAPEPIKPKCPKTCIPVERCTADGAPVTLWFEKATGEIVGHVTPGGVYVEGPWTGGPLGSCAPETPPQIDIEHVDPFCNVDTGTLEFDVIEYTDGIQTDSYNVVTDVPCLPDPVVTADIEFVCEDGADFYTQIVTPIVDGVPGTPIATVTDRPCPQDPPPEPVVTFDFETVCNLSTGFLEYHTVTIVDGVPSAPQITVTEKECAAPVPTDFETLTECRDGVLVDVLVGVAADGTVTELSAIPTGQPCNKACDVPFVPECLIKRTITVGYDNGVTPGSSSNDCGARPNFVRFSWPFEVVGWDVNGSTVGAGDPLGPFSGWSPQLQGWADWFNSNNPNAHANAAFGFDPAPTWRFTEITDCSPRSTYGPLTIRRTDTECTYVVYPVLTSETFETAYRYATLDCDGNKTVVWCDADGETVEAPENPECFVPCGFDFGPFIEGESPCVTQPPIFACNRSEDGSLTNVVVVVTDCPDGRTTEVYTTDSYTTAESPDDLVEVELVALVNCETGEEIDVPAAPCSDSYDVCPAPCANVWTYIFGRPVTQGWAWPDIGIGSTNLADFETQLEALGYTVTRWDEKHAVCPKPPGFPTVDGVSVIGSFEPNPDPDLAAATVCVLRTVGKLDAEILAAVSKPAIQIIEDCDGNMYGVSTETGDCVWGPKPPPDKKDPEEPPAEPGTILVAEGSSVGTLITGPGAGTVVAVKSFVKEVPGR